jgi:hypothetical protein
MCTPDCVLNLIRFKASAVTGWDLIVTPELQMHWHNYLSARYPYLTYTEQGSIANACQQLAIAQQKWSMSPYERELYQNMWAASLPQELAFIEPVFATGVAQIRAALQSRTAQQRLASQATNTSASQQAIGQSLQNHNRVMTGLTIDLMRSMSGR